MSTRRPHVRNPIANLHGQSWTAGPTRRRADRVQPTAADLLARSYRSARTRTRQHQRRRLREETR